MIKKICIMGRGNGAFAAAADLTLRGFDITLYYNPRYEERFAELKENRTIYVEEGDQKHSAMLRKVTTDLADALSDVDLVMPIYPAFDQRIIAQSLVPHVREGMIICLAPGSSGGALIYGKAFHEAGVFGKAKLCEMMTLPYAARKVSKDTVRILHRVDLMYFAAFPAKNNQELYDLIHPVYPTISLVTDVLETSLNNGNISSHPAAVVLNAGKIEYHDEHYHYKEGITPSVAKVNWEIDKERMAICKAFGYKQVDAMERLHLTGYSPKADNLYDAYQGSEEIFMKIAGPSSLDSRYLTEDAPKSLVFCTELARLAGVDTPVMHATVTLASALRSENYHETGRTLDKMGLDGKTIQDVKEFLYHGYV